MPRIQIPIREVNALTPVAPDTEVVADPVNDHYLDFNDGQVWLTVRNTDVGQRSFVIPTPGEMRGLGIKDNGHDIPAGETVLIGPLMPRVYNQKSDADAGRVYIDVSGNFLRFRAFHLSPQPGPRRVAPDIGTRIELPITTIYTEEHLPALVEPDPVISDSALDHKLLWNDGRVIVDINNPLGTSADITFNSQALGYGPRDSAGGPIEVSDVIVPVPAGGRRLMGGFSPEIHNLDSGAFFINVVDSGLEFRAYHLPRITEPFGSLGG